MPRVPRAKSSTGIYHVTMRGVNQSNIFHDNQDYETFLNYLKYTKDTSGVEIYAYCLMTNHIHLLLKETNEDLGITFRRLGAGFVGWYNVKYERIGHLFQRRYGSEVVESDTYLLMVMRYIHQNPIKAGLARKLMDYPWSSIHEYMKRARICNTQVGLEYFGKTDSPEARRGFLLAQEYEANAVFDPDVEERKVDAHWLDEDDVRAAFTDGCLNRLWEERGQLNKEELLHWAEMLYRYGACWRQISHETGVSRYLLTKYHR